MVKLVEAEILAHHLNWARQMFLFSFFASGINFKDMAILKVENILTSITQEGKEQRVIQFKRQENQ